MNINMSQATELNSARTACLHVSWSDCVVWEGPVKTHRRIWAARETSSSGITDVWRDYVKWGQIERRLSPYDLVKYKKNRTPGAMRKSSVAH